MAAKTKEKVVYGLRNVHYALMTDSDGAISYETPVPIPGAVSIGLTADGDIYEFYADDVAYFSTPVNNGYSGDLQMALIPDDFKQAVLGEIRDTSGIQFEDADAKPKAFALLGEFQTDQLAKRICLFNVRCQRPDISGQTKTETIEVQGQTLSLTARPVSMDGRLLVKCSTTVETSDEKYNAWFDKVPTYTAAPGV